MFWGLFFFFVCLVIFVRICDLLVGCLLCCFLFCFCLFGFYLVGGGGFFVVFFGGLFLFFNFPCLILYDLDKYRWTLIQRQRTHRAWQAKQPPGCPSTEEVIFYLIQCNYEKWQHYPEDISVLEQTVSLAIAKSGQLTFSHGIHEPRLRSRSWNTTFTEWQSACYGNRLPFICICIYAFISTCIYASSWFHIEENTFMKDHKQPTQTVIPAAVV